MPTQEPEAFRGISSAAQEATGDYKRISEEYGAYQIIEFIRHTNLACEAGQLWNKLVEERTVRPKEVLLSVPSMPKGILAFACAQRGLVEDLEGLFVQAPHPEERYTLRLRFAGGEGAWALDAPSFAKSLMSA